MNRLVGYYGKTNVPIRVESVIHVISITLEAYLKKHQKHNPEEDIPNLRENLQAAIKCKEQGAICFCGQPIWALGTAITGLDRCFTCITGESDDSEDFEVVE